MPTLSEHLFRYWKPCPGIVNSLLNLSCLRKRILCSSFVFCLLSSAAFPQADVVDAKTDEKGYFDDQKIKFDASGLPVLTNKQKLYLLDVAKKTITGVIGENSTQHFDSDFSGINNRVFLTLWQNGKKVFSWHSARDNLASSVHRAATQILKNKAISSTDDIAYHLHIFSKKKPFNQKTYKHGIHGVSLSNKTSSAFYYGAYAIETNFKREKLFERLNKKLKTADGDPAKRFMHNMLHFATSDSKTVDNFYRGNTPNITSVVTKKEFQDTMSSAQKWLLNAVKPSGEFRYLYYPSRNEFPAEKNNMIRQLMGSRTLAELASHNFLYRRKHKENLNFVFKTWYRTRGDKGYIFFKNKSKLGAMAMALRALVYSPYFEDYEKEAKQLSNTIMSMINNDGSMEPWFIAPKYKYDPDRLLTFYSGEALLSLFEYASKTNNQEVMKKAITSQKYYVKKYVDEMNKNYYPAYVPWHAQSLNKLFHLTKDRTYARAVFTMTDRLLEMQNTKLHENDLFGRFYNPATRHYGTPHSSSDAVYTEGVAYAYDLANLVGDAKRKVLYGRAIRFGIRNIINLQYNGDNMYFVKNKTAVEGGIRINVTDNKVRVDTTQHALDGFLKIEALMKAGTFKF